MIWTVILTALWLWAGAGGYIYWWKKTEKFKGTEGEIELIFITSIFGPVTFLIGWIIEKQANK